MIHAMQEAMTRTDWLIADPGDEGAIPVSFSGVCELTSGASGETRTLAAPTHRGQWLFLVFHTDGGGDVVITASAGINQTAETTITFADAGTCLYLIGCQVGTAMVWRTVAGYVDVESEGPTLA